LCYRSASFFIYPGIGEKTTEALKLMRISKVEELANCDIQILSERFGKMGLFMKQVANGLDFSEVKEWEEPVKSISRSGTFKEDTNDPIK
jgi:DNA polymerase IV (archaeal DinB-like DNA polymerase)